MIGEERNIEGEGEPVPTYQQEDSDQYMGAILGEHKLQEKDHHIYSK